MSELLPLWFHESWILNFKQAGDSIILELEDVATTDKKKCNVSINCNAIKKIETDAKLMSSDLTSGKEGGVLTLNIQDHRIELIAEWLDYSHQNSSINYYNIDCESVHIAVKPM